MISNLTFHSIFWKLLGFLLATVGGYLVYKRGMYLFGAELVLMSFGMISGGATNCFTDYSPTGRLFSRIGIISFLIGLPLVIYSIYKFI